MRKIFIFLTIVAISLLFATCSNEEVFDENTPKTERMISLTASMPNDEPSTRVLLTQDGKNIKLTWVEGDEIALVFKQGVTEETQTVILTSTNISNEGKRAQFDVVLPNEINTGTFDLYGVYGDGGLSTSNPTHAILPQNSGDATSLNDGDNYSVESRKDVMLYFASTNLQTANPQVSVLFKHLGSLFSITVNNVGNTDLDGIGGAALMEVDGYSNWAYNNYNGSVTFDLVNQEFSGTQYYDNFLYFSAKDSYLESGESITFWAWYAPIPGVIWPELKLVILDDDAPGYPDPQYILFETENTKPARTQPTMAGKTYYFNAELDDLELTFTENETYPIESITDSRDDNVYKIITIGTQVWMAENLRFLPSVTAGPTIGSETDPHYYVYNNYGTSVSAAKATANYIDYGVLYNWPAAMAGSLGSDSNPSGVQGVCPTGWHLPSSSEWEVLVDYLGDMDNAGGRLKATGTLYWEYPNYKASNASGFTALPGGHRNQGGTFSNINRLGYWWTATDNSVSNFATIRSVKNDDIEVYWYGISKEFAYSIRCVKDDVNVGM